MKGIVLVVLMGAAMVTLVSTACGDDGGEGALIPEPSHELPEEFQEPESAIRKLFEYVDKKQWDLEYAALVQQHQDACPIAAFNTRQSDNAFIGRINVKKVENIRNLVEWQWYSDAVALTVTLDFKRGDHSVETAATFHLIEREGFYRWGMTDDALQECMDVASQ